MNKVIYQDGRKPFTTTDISYDIDALTNALNDLYTASSIYAKYIVTGCILTQSDANVQLTAGSIFYNGEYFKVDAKTFNNTDISVINGYSFDLLEDWDPNGNYTYFDNSQKNMYKIRKAQLVSATITFTDTLYSTMKNINSDLVSLLPDASQSVKGVTLLATNEDVLYGSNNIKAITPATLAFKQPYAQKLIPIGAWNMDENTGKNIYLSDYNLACSQVIDVSVIVYSDDLFNRWNLEVSGSWNCSGPSILYISRIASGTFDNTGYDDAVMDRGTILITYKNN